MSVSSTVAARAALAGNPSDGHGGAVVSTTVSSVAATVTVSGCSRFEFPGLGPSFESIHELSEWTGRDHSGGDQPLVQAALVALHRRYDTDLAPAEFTLTTTIPRSVGLAGSSAIVIATINTTLERNRGDRWVRELVGRPELIASVALDAERDVLGISAGLQDRVVQAFGGTVAMDFAPELIRRSHGATVGAYRSLGTLPDGLFVACRPGTAGDSGAVHAGIDPADATVRRAMSDAADAGRAAAVAIETDDVRALGRAMNDTFDARAAVFPLEPGHAEMISVARASGASANYTGSGGSVIVLAPDDAARRALASMGCRLLEL